jgi:hypothetical protein
MGGCRLDVFERRTVDSPGVDAVVIVLLDDLPLLDAEEHPEIRLHDVARLERPQLYRQGPGPSRLRAHPVAVRHQAADFIDMLGDDGLALFEILQQRLLAAGFAVGIQPAGELVLDHVFVEEVLEPVHGNGVLYGLEVIADQFFVLRIHGCSVNAFPIPVRKGIKAHAYRKGKNLRASGRNRPAEVVGEAQVAGYPGCMA